MARVVLWGEVILGLDEAAAFFGRIDDPRWDIIFRIQVQATRTYCSRPPSLCSQTEGMPSRAAQGDWKLGANGCRVASRSKELGDKELLGALVGERDRERSGFTVS